MSKAIQVPSDLSDEIALKRFLSELVQRLQKAEEQNASLSEELKQLKQEQK